MYALGLGVFLAAWFVAAYFIYRKVFSREREEPWATPAIQTPDTPQLTGRHSKLFLTTEEMSAHHTRDYTDEER